MGQLAAAGQEFINHSCEPNLYARVRAGRIWFISLRRIEAGEELLLDYQLTDRDPIYPCCCGSPSCRGYMNQPFDQTL